MMNLLTALIYPVLLGFLVLSVMLRGISIRYRFLFYLGASFPTGAGLCSLILFTAYVVLPAGAKQISLIAGFFIGAVLLGYRFFHLQKDLRRSGFFWPSALNIEKSLFLQALPSGLALLLFAYTLVTVIQFYTLSAPMDVFVYGGGDARFIWALKAKFLFRAPETWLNMFSSKIFWSNTDYPLLLSGMLAWGWNWLGRESPLWAPLVYLGFYLSCSWILVWYLSLRISPASGWIGGTLFLVLMPYLQNSVRQFADVPVTFFITACGLTLAAALRSNQGKLFAVSGLLGGLAAWTKNDGVLFVGWIYVLVGAICVLRCLGRSKDPFASLRWFTLGAFLPLLAAGALKFFPETHGVYLGSGVLQKYLRNDPSPLITGWPRIFTIFKAFYLEMSRPDKWKGLWGFFILAVIAIGIRKEKPRGDYPWILFGIVILVNAGYVAIFYITRYNLIWHLRSTLDRLVLHSGLLALAFCFEGLGAFSPKFARPDPGSQEKISP